MNSQLEVLVLLNCMDSGHRLGHRSHPKVLGRRLVQTNTNDRWTFGGKAPKPPQDLPRSAFVLLAFALPVWRATEGSRAVAVSLRLLLLLPPPLLLSSGGRRAVERRAALLPCGLGCFGRGWEPSIAGGGSGKTCGTCGDVDGMFSALPSWTDVDEAFWYSSACLLGGVLKGCWGGGSRVPRSLRRTKRAGVHSPAQWRLDQRKQRAHAYALVGGVLTEAHPLTDCLERVRKGSTLPPALGRRLLRRSGGGVARGRVWVPH